CGAGCASPWDGDGYVRLYDIDIGRLHGSELPILMQQQGYGDPPEVIPKLGTRFDAHGQRVCVALAGSAAGPCACSIYEQRPEACRRFEMGSVLCREARRRFGLPL